MPGDRSDPDFEAFRQLVLADPSLQVRLMQLEDASEFIALVIELASERGWWVAEDEVRSALNAGRRVWIERWIQP